MATVEFTTAQLIDLRTYCIRLAYTCSARGKAPTDTNAFVNRCVNTLPSEFTGPVPVVSDGITQYAAWAIRDAAGGSVPNPMGPRNVSIYGKLLPRDVVNGKPVGPGGQTNLDPRATEQQMLNGHADKHCDDFNDPDSGMRSWQEVDEPAFPQFPLKLNVRLGFLDRLTGWMGGASDAISWGAAVVCGGILLWLSKGALPVAEPAPAGFGPMLGTDLSNPYAGGA